MKSTDSCQNASRSLICLRRGSAGIGRIVAVAGLTLLTACIGPHKPVATDKTSATPAAAPVQGESIGDSGGDKATQARQSPPALPVPLPVPVQAEVLAGTGAPTRDDAPVVDVKPVHIVAQAESYHVTTTATATKTDTPIMETPMSVKVVPQQVMRDQQVVRVDQALKNVSGVISGAEGDMQFNVRGFDQFNFYRDGYPFQSQWFHGEDLTNIERVEVLKGPGSILYGRAEPGGIINFVTKQPLDQPYYSLQQ
ncbi:MAG: hypothetical protein LZF60_310004 [Nitrospira sp.]|nr:MAG: hypothetical protein LZF60_310004 [Nitrospira sp.]